jgi:DNA-binding GntR family transcriptional regulator
MKTADARTRYRTLQQIVLEHLRDNIATGVYPPGQKLNEPELAAQYGVSRGPVREALRRLEGQGLVRMVPGKGATVTSLTAAEIAEIYDIRIELEGLGARIGTRHIDDAGLRKMKTLVTKMGKALESTLTWIKLNDEFHMTLYQASGMKQLCEIINDLMVRTFPYSHVYLSPPAVLQKTHHPDHPQLYEAVSARDESLAEEITRRHLYVGSREIIHFVSELDSPEPTH